MLYVIRHARSYRVVQQRISKQESLTYRSRRRQKQDQHSLPAPRVENRCHGGHAGTSFAGVAQPEGLR